MGYTSLPVVDEVIKKKYSIEISNSMELSEAANGAYLICGYLNQECVSQEIRNSEYQLNPVCNIITANHEQHHIPSVVLFIPSTVSFYSPIFLSDMTHLQAKGLWLQNCHLATDTMLKMLPSILLHLQKDGGVPGNEGLLSEFMDIYQISVTLVNNPIMTLQPVLHDIHVDDKDICILHDVIIGRSNCRAGSTESTMENFC